MPIQPPPTEAGLRDLLVAQRLLPHIGHPIRLERVGLWLSHKALAQRPGPDGTLLTFGGRVWPDASAWTAGSVILLRQEYLDLPAEHPRLRCLLNHEYVHVLQIRARGWPRFYLRYGLDWLYCQLRALLGRPITIWERSRDERVALQVEGTYRRDLTLPDLWTFRSS